MRGDSGSVGISAGRVHIAEYLMEQQKLHDFAIRVISELDSAGFTLKQKSQILSKAYHYTREAIKNENIGMGKEQVSEQKQE